jgi:hypothetical protein
MKGTTQMASPAAKITWDAIKTCILSVENDPNIGRGKISKRDFLTDKLYIMFKDAAEASVDASIATKDAPLKLS